MNCLMLLMLCMMLKFDLVAVAWLWYIGFDVL